MVFYLTHYYFTKYVDVFYAESSLVLVLLKKHFCHLFWLSLLIQSFHL